MLIISHLEGEISSDIDLTITLEKATFLSMAIKNTKYSS